MKKKFPDHFNKLKNILEQELKNMDMSRLGKYNFSYTKNKDDPFAYMVESEWAYYEKVLSWYLDNVPKSSTVLEIGMFVPVIPLLLSWEGYKVTAIENLNFYGKALDPMVKIAKDNDIEFLNIDIIEDDLDDKKYDCINLRAVIEHIVGRPKALLAKIRLMLNESGSFVFVVPNQARLVRRLGLMFGGISVLPEYEDYYKSDYPYEGHHREYVLSEVKYMFAKSNFIITRLDSVKYKPHGSLLKKIITIIGNFLPKQFHQAFFVIAKKNKY